MGTTDILAWMIAPRMAVATCESMIAQGNAGLHCLIYSLQSAATFQKRCAGSQYLILSTVCMLQPFHGNHLAVLQLLNKQTYATGVYVQPCKGMRTRRDTTRHDPTSAHLIGSKHHMKTRMNDATVQKHIYSLQKLHM